MTETPTKDPLAVQGATETDATQGGDAGAPKAPDPAPNKAPEKTEEAPKTDDPGKEETPSDPAKDAPEDAPEATSEEWDATGDKALDDAISMLREGGLKKSEAEAIFAEVIKTQDITKVDLPALEKALGKSAANLVVLGVTDYIRRTQEKNAAITTLVHETVGGKEAWDVATGWANERAKTDTKFAAELGEVADMLDRGGWQAKAAALHLQGLYEGAKENGSLNKGLESPTGTAKENGAGWALGRDAYVAAMKEAQQKGDAAQIAQLRQRRQAGREAGLR